MALKSWHYGKLIILWVWGAFLATFAWYFLNDFEPEGTGELISGFLLIALLLAIPAGLSVITWKWLGGKERE